MNSCPSRAKKHPKNKSEIQEHRNHFANSLKIKKSSGIKKDIQQQEAELHSVSISFPLTSELCSIYISVLLSFSHSFCTFRFIFYFCTFCWIFKFFLLLFSLVHSALLCIYS